MHFRHFTLRKKKLVIGKEQMSLLGLPFSMNKSSHFEGLSTEQ